MGSWMLGFAVLYWFKISSAEFTSRKYLSFFFNCLLLVSTKNIATSTPRLQKYIPKQINQCIFLDLRIYFVIYVFLCIFMYVCLCEFLCTMWCRCWRRPEGVGSPATGATEKGCELSDVGAKKQTWVLCRNSSHSNHWAIAPTPYLFKKQPSWLRGGVACL